MRESKHEFPGAQICPQLIKGKDWTAIVLSVVLHLLILPLIVPMAPKAPKAPEVQTDIAGQGDA